MARSGVRGTFSQPGPSHPTAAVRLTRTLCPTAEESFSPLAASPCNRCQFLAVAGYVTDRREMRVRWWQARPWECTRFRFFGSHRTHLKHREQDQDNEGIDGMTSHTQDVQPTRQLRAFVQRLGQQLDCPIAQHKVDETTAELLPNQLRVIAPCCGAKNA